MLMMMVVDMFGRMSIIMMMVVKVPVAAMRIPVFVIVDVMVRTVVVIVILVMTINVRHDRSCVQCELKWRLFQFNWAIR